ncbi:alpha/beta-hydrolase [Ganoderma leucocontextum]|nr:alpha/beta-hydrolase [Ganoderma leucocontextum]
MASTVLPLLCLSGILFGGQIFAQRTAPPNSYPHAWQGQPQTPLGPDWQHYFEVKYPLPNLAHIALPRSFAGNIPVDRAGHPNNTLFFWAFERNGTEGTLTAPAGSENKEPWIIWLQGGPGSSSLLGLFRENGPIHITSTNVFEANPFSWNTLADVIWIDQPVGTGYSTVDAQGYVPNEDQMAEDFLAFLTNLVRVFPSLSTRPLYLMGESYAGHFIPYITKHLFSVPNPPVNLRKVAIGDGFVGSFATVRNLPVVNILETYPGIIGYDQDVFHYFKEQHHLCGFDLNLTYPQTSGTFPTLAMPMGQRATPPEAQESRRIIRSWEESQLRELVARELHGESAQTREQDKHQEAKRARWKRDLSRRANGTLDPWYGCDLFNEMWDYALNFTFPWTNGHANVYEIPDATNPRPPKDIASFLNSADVRAALHAPLSKNWSIHVTYPFNSVYDLSIGNIHGDPSVEPVAFLTPLFANASARGVPFVFYSGNDDSDIQHRGTEVVIQNFTFGGAQGFTRRPSTPWYDDARAPAGIVHQERNVTYVLFNQGGHTLPEYMPRPALVFLREFVLGHNPNGTVLQDGTVVGGEDAALAKEHMGGGGRVFYGSAKTEGTWTWPSATVAAWEKFIATAAAVDAVPAASTARHDTVEL